MRNLYIYHHLGLGDHIICNGLVRNICARHPEDNINLFCKPRYYSSVAFMYRDLDDLQVIKADDSKVRSLLKLFDSGFIVGHENLRYENNLSFDHLFYKQLDIPFIYRWDRYKTIRDMGREQDLFNRLNLKEPYAFVHDDANRSLIIDRKYISTGLRIISPSDVTVENIFDYMLVMEQAEEVHCMDSCFRLMFDSLASKHGKLFYHLHLSNNVIKDFTHSQSKLNWKKI